MVGCRFSEGVVSQGWFDWVKLAWILFRSQCNGTTFHGLLFMGDALGDCPVRGVLPFGAGVVGLTTDQQLEGRLRNADNFVTRSLVRKAVFDRYGVHATCCIVE